VIVTAGCHRDDGATTAPTYLASREAASAHHHPATRLAAGPLPTEELQRARVATARYNDVDNAFADGYVDIGLVIPNMGRHLLRPEVPPVEGEVPVDGIVDLQRPELLVYQPTDDGELKLVAVEWAVPRKLFDVPPEGFTGDADVWFDDPVFKVWTLHAWIWKQNPDGIFNATNSRVP
jgi:hypothetical protein